MMGSTSTVQSPLVFDDRNTPLADVCRSSPLQVSDDDLLSQYVERALRSNGHIHLRCLEVSVRTGQVVLSGRVPSYYVKQVAQAVALAVCGVRTVRNELTVTSHR